MKLLIVRLSAFGDIIHCLPALDDLLNRPEVSEIHWLVDSRYRFVTDILPREVMVHSVALKGEQPLRAAWRMVRKLQKIEFDAILDLQGLIKSALLSRLIGSPVYGFDKRFLREKPAGLLIEHVPFHDEEQHVVQYYRRIATAPFSDNSAAEAIPYAAPHIHFEQSHCSEDGDLLTSLGLADQGYMILHSAGGWETKQLPDTSWLAVAEAINDRGITPVFSWGNSKEQQKAQSLARQCNGFALPERLNMSALCTLIRHARCIIGADTGLLHLSAALDRPTITFWGPSASWRSAPLERKNEATRRQWHVESNPACGPCFKRRCDQFTCMDAIDPASIIRIIDEL